MEIINFDIDEFELDVDPYNYKKTFDFLRKYYQNSESNYYEKIYNEIKKYNLRKYPFYDHDNNIDLMLLEYSKFRKNIKVMIIWPNNDLIETMSLLKEKCYIYSVKKIELDNKSAINLIFQVYNMFSYDEIKKKSQEFGWDNKNKRDIIIILFEPFENINYSVLNGYLSENINDAIKLVEIFYNENSLNFLNRQNIEIFLNEKNKNAIQNLEIYMTWLKKNVYLIDEERFILQSGMVLSVHGIRSTRDIDLIFCHNKNKKYITPNLENLINKAMIDPKTKYKFMDIWFKGLNWRDYFDEWSVKWANSFGANNIFDAILNPKYHFYFMGVKFLILEAEVARRKERIESKLNNLAVWDLIMIKELILPDLDIPIYPKNAKIWIKKYDPISKKYIRKQIPYKFNLDHIIKDVKNFVKIKFGPLGNDISDKLIIDKLKRYNIIKNYIN